MGEQQLRDPRRIMPGAATVDAAVSEVQQRLPAMGPAEGAGERRVGSEQLGRGGDVADPGRGVDRRRTEPRVRSEQRPGLDESGRVVGTVGQARKAEELVAQPRGVSDRRADRGAVRRPPQ